MKTIDPVQSVQLPDRIKKPSERAWRRIEEAGGIKLTQYARRRISDAVLTYVVAVMAVRRAPELKKVQELIRALAEGAQSFSDGESADSLIKSLEALMALDNHSFAAALYWSEISSINLGDLLVRLYSGEIQTNDLIDQLISASEATRNALDEEYFGKTHGPRDLGSPAGELLTVILPMFQRRGGKGRYYSPGLGEGSELKTPLVCFLYELLHSFVPNDWPEREAFALDHKAWAWRVKKFVMKPRRNAKKPSKNRH